MKKTICYIKTGGFFEVLDYALVKILRFTGYKNYSIHVNCPKELFCFESDFSAQDVKIVEFSSVQEIENLGFERLFYTPYKAWLSKGSKLYVSFYKDQPMGYIWSQFNSHIVDGDDYIDQAQGVSWLGPGFIHKDFRGKRAYIHMLSHAMRESFNNGASKIITCASYNNVAPLKTFEKLGFSYSFYQHQAYKKGERILNLRLLEKD